MPAARDARDARSPRSPRAPRGTGSEGATAGVRSRFVERLGATLASLGVPRLPARIFAALMADEDGRMTAAELGAALGVSAASISGGVRFLAQVRMIHREREPGSRRDVFVVADDAWHEMMLTAGQSYGPLASSLAEGIGTVGGAGTHAGRRLQTSVDFLDFLSDELAGVAARWEARRAASGG